MSLITCVFICLLCVLFLETGRVSGSNSNKASTSTSTRSNSIRSSRDGIKYSHDEHHKALLSSPFEVTALASSKTSDKSDLDSKISSNPSLRLMNIPHAQHKEQDLSYSNSKRSIFILQNSPTLHPSQPSSQPSSLPSSQPSSQPSIDPTIQPSSSPSNLPSMQPTQEPSCQPSRQPTRQPSSQPSMAPSCPSSQPSMQPSSQPVARPTMQPSSQPSRRPTIQPTSFPTNPTTQPSRRPTTLPSTQPSSQPSAQPNMRPSSQPSAQPSVSPLGPSAQPTQAPTQDPSSQPTMQPSRQPFSFPTMQPSRQPTSNPSNPSSQPSSFPTQPSAEPSSFPSCPSGQPSTLPSVSPLYTPTCQPSSQPTFNPSGPTTQPYSHPTCQPTRQPSRQPSSQPFAHPSSNPSALPTCPTSKPSVQPSRLPSMQPTCIPSSLPTSQPYGKPTNQPTIQPSSMPTLEPTSQPSASPSNPSSQPTMLPSRQPSIQPSRLPTQQPSSYPSMQPSIQPSIQPTSQPSVQPTTHPTWLLSRVATPKIREYTLLFISRRTSIDISVELSNDGFLHCAIYEKSKVALTPPTLSNIYDEGFGDLTVYLVAKFQFIDLIPSTDYSIYCAPSLYARDLSQEVEAEVRIFEVSTPCCKLVTIKPQYPSIYKGLQIADFLSVSLSHRPSAGSLTVDISVDGTAFSPFMPYTLDILSSDLDYTGQFYLSYLDSLNLGNYNYTATLSGTAANEFVVEYTFDNERLDGSLSVLDFNTLMKFEAPKLVEAIYSDDGSSVIISFDTRTNMASHMGLGRTFLCSDILIFNCSDTYYQETTILPIPQPTSMPSTSPSQQPTHIQNKPSSMPSARPSKSPLRPRPTSQPSRQPTSQPSRQPSRQPTSQPSRQPTRQPTGQPSVMPSNPSGQPTFSPSLPTAQPSMRPSSPSSQPSRRPSMQPIMCPTTLPSTQPSMQPSRVPTAQPSRQPTRQPSSQPSSQPSNPTSQPTTMPSNPSAQPSSNPSGPSSSPSRQPSRQPTRRPSESPSGQPSSVPSIYHEPVFASKRQCEWDPTGSKIYMSVSGDFCVNIGSFVFIKPKVLKGVCPPRPYTSSFGSNWEDECSRRVAVVSSNVSVEVLPPKLPKVPTVVIKAPTVIGRCDDLVINHALSRGDLGRPWSTFVLNAFAKGPLGDVVEAGEVKVFLKFEYWHYPFPRPIPRNLFISGYTYTFRLKLCNYFGKCAVNDATVLVSNKTMIATEINAPSLVRIQRNNPLFIDAETIWGQCAIENIKRSEVSYNWTVTDVGGVSPPINSESKNAFILKLSPFILSLNRRYQIEFTAHSSFPGHIFTTSDKILLDVVHGNVIASIRGSQDKLVQMDNHVVLDAAFGSYDEDVGGLDSGTNARHLSFEISRCRRILPTIVDACVFNVSTISSGIYSFAPVYHGGLSIGSTSEISIVVFETFNPARRATASARITVVCNSCPVVKVFMDEGDGLRLGSSKGVGRGTLERINLNRRIVLAGLIEDSIRFSTNSYNVSWEVDDPSVDLDSISPLPVKKRVISEDAIYPINLILTANSLPLVSSLTFKLTVSNSSSVSYSASILLHFNKPPQPGRFIVFPKEGVEYFTFFLFNAVEWHDEDLPLTYSFGYLNGIGVYVPTSEKMGFNTGSFWLPAGISDTDIKINSYLDRKSKTVCILDIFDSLGANTTETSEVMIERISDPFVRQERMNEVLGELEYSLTSYRDNKHILALILGSINDRDCSFAPNCNLINRMPCTGEVPHTCGLCKPSYVGVNRRDNTPCIESGFIISPENYTCYIDPSTQEFAGCPVPLVCEEKTLLCRTPPLTCPSLRWKPFKKRAEPTRSPTRIPTLHPTKESEFSPTHPPSSYPSSKPTTNLITSFPTSWPTSHPTGTPTSNPTAAPTILSPFECSGHGVCKLTKIDAGLIQDVKPENCTILTLNCYATCLCDVGWVGAACTIELDPYGPPNWQSTVNKLVKTIKYIADNEDISEKSVIDWLMLTKSVAYNLDFITGDHAATLQSLLLKVLDGMFAMGMSLEYVNLIMETMDVLAYASQLHDMLDKAYFYHVKKGPFLRHRRLHDAPEPYVIPSSIEVDQGIHIVVHNNGTTDLLSDESQLHSYPIISPQGYRKLRYRHGESENRVTVPQVPYPPDYWFINDMNRIRNKTAIAHTTTSALLRIGQLLGREMVQGEQRKLLSYPAFSLLVDLVEPGFNETLYTHPSPLEIINHRPMSSIVLPPGYVNDTMCVIVATMELAIMEGFDYHRTHSKPFHFSVYRRYNDSTSLSNRMDSTRNRRRLSKVPAPGYHGSGTDESNMVRITLQNQKYYNMSSFNFPQYITPNITFRCYNEDYSRQTLVCNDDYTSTPIMFYFYCRGMKENLVARCPFFYRRPKCGGIYRQNASEHCVEVSVSESVLVCDCSLPVPRQVDRGSSTAVQETSLEFSLMARTQDIYNNVRFSWLETDSFTSYTDEDSVIVKWSLWGSVVLVVPLILLLHVFDKYQSLSLPEKGKFVELNIGGLLLVTKTLFGYTEDIKLRSGELTDAFARSLPVVFQPYKPMWQRILYETSHGHSWFDILLVRSEHQPRFIRLVSVLFSIVSVLYIQSHIYASFTHHNYDKCTSVTSNYTNFGGERFDDNIRTLTIMKDECRELMVTIFFHKFPQCDWNVNDGVCQPQFIGSNMNVILWVFLISSVIAAPVYSFCSWLFLKVIYLPIIFDDAVEAQLVAEKEKETDKDKEKAKNERFDVFAELRKFIIHLRLHRSTLKKFPDQLARFDDTWMIHGLDDRDYDSRRQFGYDAKDVFVVARVRYEANYRRLLSIKRSLICCYEYPEFDVDTKAIVLKALKTTQQRVENEELFRVSSNQEITGRRILQLFVHDNLPNWSSANAFLNKINRDERKQHKIRLVWRIMASIIVFGGYGYMCYSITLYGTRQKYNYQYALFKTFVSWLVLDVGVISTIRSFFINFLIPYVMVARDLKSLRPLFFSIVNKFYKSKLKNQVEDVYDEYNKAHGEVTLNTAPFFHVSQKVAAALPRLLESQLVRSYSTISSFRLFHDLHRLSDNDYSNIFGKPLSLLANLVLTILDGFLSLPFWIQDSITTLIGIGITVVLAYYHVMLWKIYIGLAFVPILSIMAFYYIYRRFTFKTQKHLVTKKKSRRKIMKFNTRMSNDDRVAYTCDRPDEEDGSNKNDGLDRDPGAGDGSAKVDKASMNARNTYRYKAATNAKVERPKGLPIIGLGYDDDSSDDQSSNDYSEGVSDANAKTQSAGNTEEKEETSITHTEIFIDGFDYVNKVSRNL